jgi:hypothetical protein
LGGLIQGGDAIQLRFDLGKDGCAGFDGWYLDDLVLYDCVGTADCNANDVPDTLDVARGEHLDVIVRHKHLLSGRFISDADDNGLGVRSRAQRLSLTHPKRVGLIKIWGGFFPESRNEGNQFSVIVHTARGGLPHAVIIRQDHVPFEQSLKIPPEENLGAGTWEFALRLAYPLHLPAGDYFIEVFNNTAGNGDTFVWEAANYTGTPGFASAPEAPGMNWSFGGPFNLSIEILGDLVGSDCDLDGTPDECATDCNGNGVADPCDIAHGVSLDDNQNGLPDECGCDQTRYGDVSPAGGDGDVDMDDLFCVLDAFRVPAACASADLYPCGGDGRISVFDLLAVVDAFGGVDPCCGR